MAKKKSPEQIAAAAARAVAHAAATPSRVVSQGLAQDLAATKGPASSVARAERRVGGVLSTGVGQLESTGGDINAAIGAFHDWLTGTPEGQAAGFTTAQVAQMRKAATQFGPQVPKPGAAPAPPATRTPATPGGAGTPVVPGSANDPNSVAGQEAIANETASYQANLTNQATITQNQTDAVSALTGELAGLGMPAATSARLAQWALGEVAAGKSVSQVTTVDIYNNPDFIAATPGLKERIANGHPAMNVADYLTYRATVQAQAAAADFPKGFVTDQTIGNLVAGDVSADEVSSRINDAFAVSQHADPNITKAMADYYGVKSPGAIAAFFLDPDHATSVLNQQATAAQIGGFGAAAGGSELSQADAMAFARAGVSASQGQGAAGSTAGALAATRAGVGVGAAPTATEAELLGSQLGAASATESVAQEQQRVQNAIGARTSQFHGGGGVAGAGSRGTTGAGSGTQ